MSSKPIRQAPWATDANYPADAAPEAGTAQKTAYTQSALGYRPDENPTAQQDNDWRNVVGSWVTYLHDGSFTGPIVITGDLTVTAGDTLFDFGGGGSFEIISAAPAEFDCDVDLDVGKVITVDGRNNRGLIMGAAATSYLSKDVPLDDRSIDNSFQTPGTLSISQTSAHETIRTFSTNGAKFQAKCIHNEPGDQIEYITVVYDGPIPSGTWPDIRLLHYTGTQLVSVALTTTTDSTGANQHRVGGAGTGAGRTFQRYAVVDPEPIACGTVGSTAWQSAGTAHVEVTANQVNTQIFRIFVEYRRKQPINYGV